MITFTWINYIYQKNDKNYWDCYHLHKMYNKFILLALTDLIIFSYFLIFFYHPTNVIYIINVP